MAPFNLMTATVSLLAKSFGVFSIGNPARCASVFCSTNINPVKYLTTEASGPPKKPLNGYLRFVCQQKPLITRQNPEMKLLDVVRNIAQQWKMMSPEQKQSFQKAYFLDMEQYKLDFQKFKAQLSPAQLQELAANKRMRLKRKKALVKKRELNRLGKPKRPRSGFNVFMSEKFLEAKGTNNKEKFASVFEDWRNLSSQHKQEYSQLAEDDKIRYKNEIELWEEHMLELGREDVIRCKTLSKINKARVKTSKVKKTTKAKAKSKAAEGTAVKKSKATRKVSTKT